ncbi:MAG: hypothetical protein HC828_10150 [Blastochloris sp.]|nr:hypothetical protein [Blastochloris sp.]
MHSQLLPSFQPPFSVRVILTGTLSKLTLEFANFTGVAGSEFAMLSVAVKPEHTRMHLETERLQEKQLNSGTNLVDVSRALLRIVAHLSETQYSETTSTELSEQQAEVVRHTDLPNPASDVDTSQG